MTYDLRGKRICITGGAGFLGQAVVAEAQKREPAEIIVPRRAEYDLRDEAAVVRLYTETTPDVVIHLAAVVGGIGANRENPGSFFYDNAMMGLHLIEQARRHELEKFVCIGTICAYPNHTPIPFKEDDLWNGYPEPTNAPYGIAKKALLVQLQSYRQQWGFPGIYLLPVNLYGPKDNFDLESSHVIPALIRKCIEARDAGRDEIVCWGDGTPTREFLYSEDAAEGILLATERYDDPDPVNLGSGEEIAIKDLVELIAKETGFTGTITWDTDKPNGQPRRCLDVTRAKERFGFTANTSFADGLRKTIEWWEAEGKAAAE
jgi:GDP-L-fucose synthase